MSPLLFLPHRLAATPEQVRDGVREPALVEVRTERQTNVRLHREVCERAIG